MWQIYRKRLIEFIPRTWPGPEILQALDIHLRHRQAVA